MASALSWKRAPDFGPTSAKPPTARNARKPSLRRRLKLALLCSTSAWSSRPPPAVTVSSKRPPTMSKSWFRPTIAPDSSRPTNSAYAEIAGCGWSARGAFVVGLLLGIVGPCKEEAPLEERGRRAANRHCVSHALQPAPRDERNTGADDQDQAHDPSPEHASRP